METITKRTKVLYTGKTHTTGGRKHGISKSSDGHLEIKLSTPGTNGGGTNPEQLFAPAGRHVLKELWRRLPIECILPFRKIQPLMLKWISVWIRESIHCKPASMLVFPGWIEKLVARLLRRPGKSALIQKLSRAMWMLSIRWCRITINGRFISYL